MSGRAPPPAYPPPARPKSRGLGWFLAVSGAIVLLLGLGCVLAVSDGNLLSEDGALAVFCASPALALGGVFLWLGSRRLKR